MKHPVYKILWIDDHYETLHGVSSSAKDYGLSLVGFKSIEAGLKELKLNYRTYDGVIFDAKVFERETDGVGSENVRASIRGKDLLKDQVPKKFEIFILTGQSKTYQDDTFKSVFNHIYRKGIDHKELFEALRVSCAAQPERQLLHDYGRVFDVCTDTYIGSTTAADLLFLLKKKELESFSGGWNMIRKIVEDVFKAMAEHELIPHAYVHPNMHIVPTSRFLARDHKNKPVRIGRDQTKNFKYTGIDIPKPILSILRELTSLTNSGSHRGEIDAYSEYVKSPYLFCSLLYKLMELMVWFKVYIDDEPKKRQWKELK